MGRILSMKQVSELGFVAGGMHGYSNAKLLQHRIAVLGSDIVLHWKYISMSITRTKCTKATSV